MPNYLVLTEHDRNIVIKADYFTQVESGEYHFLNGHKPSNNLVAAVSQHVLAVIEDDTAFVTDWYDEPEEEEDHDDTCLDCRILEFLDSQEGFNAVADIVEGVLGYREELANDPPKPEIKHYVNGGKHVWGFQTPKGFVDFSEKDYAQAGLKSYLEGDVDGWTYNNLGGFSKVKETIQ